MIDAETFLRKGSARGYQFYTGVPCSYLKPFINYVIDAPDFSYVPAANEGDAVAIAAGAALGGRAAVVMFQNSGLGNAVNPLTSLNHIFRIPVLLIVTLRGQPGGPGDEPQHALMGRITTRQLDLMEIPWRYFPTDPGAVDACWDQAVASMAALGRPFALAMAKGAVAPYRLRTAREAPGRVVSRIDAPEDGPDAALHARPRRGDILAALQAATGAQDLVLATTGYTGRELYALSDRANQFYMVGSMGCIASLGLGLALSRPDRRIIVLDGDGAALMRLGALATIGAAQPANLIHVLLDNGVHESTGGQATVSDHIDFCAIAAGAGYRHVARLRMPADLDDALHADPDGPAFLHVRIRPGVPQDLPRPKLAPEAAAARFRAAVAGAR